MIVEPTASELRETGISVIGDVRWGTHFCYFYETKQDLLETQVLYFKAGLESKEFCLWVVSQALSVEEAKHALGQAVPDLERHLAEGALEILSHDEWYLRDGRWDPRRVLQSWREKLNQTLRNGYAGLRAAGDGGWIQNNDWMVFRDYEQQVNALLADQRSIILCTYPLATSPGNQVFDIAHIHQVAVARRNGSWEMIEIAELKEAKAEIKRLNDELELKVEKRTRELATINEALRTEIAERKLAEAAVKQGEDRLRRVIDTIPTMAWSLRPDGVLDFLNQRWLDYTGLTLQEAIEEPTRTVHPEDLSRVMEKWLVVKATNEVYEDEMRLRRADGEYRWFLVRIAPLLDEQGNLLKRYGVSIDIEDRKQAERQSQALIDAIPHQIWSGPADGTLDYCNDRWRAYMGLEQKDLCGDGWQSMLHPDERDRVLKAWHGSVVNGTPYEQEERHRGADGKYRWFLARGVPMRDVEGRIVRWYGTNTDIEDRKRAEGALRESETRFRQVAENISAVFWLSNPEGSLLHYVSPAYEKIWGRSCDSLYAEPGSWMDSVLPDDRERLAEDDRLQAVGGRHDHTYRIARPDGSLRWIRGRAFPVLDEAGKLIRVAGIAEDITKRKEAEERLRRSEEKFKALFGIAPVGISVLDEQHKVVDANPALEQITRLSKAELLDGTYRRRTYLNADGTPKPPNEMASARAITENRPINDVETGIVTENREIIWTQVSVAPLALPDASAVVITQDITERKQAEQALRESEERFRELAENINEVFWVWTAPPGAARLLYVSPAYATIWGRSCESLYSLPQSWKEALHPDDKEWVLAEIAELDFEKMNDLTYRIVRPDQSIRWIRDRIFPVRDANDVVVRFAGIAQDITENKVAEEALRQSEVKLRRLLASNILGVVFWTIEGDILDANDLFLKMVGYTREDLCQGKVRWKDLTPPEYAGVDEKAIGELLRSGTCASFEKEYIRKDGSRLSVLIGSALLEDHKQAGSSFVMDITERRKTEERLVHYTHMLRTLSRRLFDVQEEERRHLARELHDEIGQALTAAKINLQSVTGDSSSATFARLQETTAILDRLLGQVRQISLDLRPSMLDDLGLVPALRSLMDQQGRRASVEMRLSVDNLPESFDAKIQTTCFRIAQEAITNALRHARAARVDVDLRRTGENLRLVIRDNGIGFQAESAQVQTAGLGLIGIQERAALLGGRAKIISSPNKGTMIEVSLPLTFRPERQDRYFGK